MNQLPLKSLYVTLSELFSSRPRRYLHASSALFAGLALRATAQTILFVLVARTLGATGYGGLIAVMAVATLFAPLAGLGAQTLLVREGARHPRRIQMHLSDALVLWAVSVPPLVIFAFVACQVVMPSILPAWAVAAIVFSDVAGATLIELLARTWQAMNRVGCFGFTMAGLVVLRLAVFCSLLGFAQPSPAQWAAWYAVATFTYVMFACSVTFRRFGCPRVSARSFGRLAAAGFPFAFAGAASRVQAEVNKPILARVDTLAGVGVFSAAQRIIDLINFPVTVLIEAAKPRLFKIGDYSLKKQFLALSSSVAAGLVGSAMVFVIAPAIPLILGSDFNSSVKTLQFCAGIPALSAIRLSLHLVVTARNQQYIFIPAYLLGGGLAIFITASLASALGVAAAVIALYSSELILIFVFLLCVFFVRPPFLKR